MQYSFKDKTYFAKPKDDWKDRIEIEIGDSKQPDKFYPQMKIMRWDNEVNFSARLDDFDNFSVSKAGNKIKVVGDKREVHFYDIAPCGDHPLGAYEFGVVLKEKPTSNVISFTIETKGVDFFKQTEERRQFDNGDWNCAENVPGSYAVYASERKINYINGKEYKCGKIGHIFRPCFKDSLGSFTWANLDIDKDKGIITIKIPQEFLDKAVYPITGNDLRFGYEGEGVYSSDNDYTYRYYGSVYAGVAGTGVSMSGFVKKILNNANADFGVYISSTSAKLTNGTTGTVAVTSTTYSWKTSNFTSAPTFTAVNYVLLARTDSGSAGWTIAYDTGSANQGQDDYETGTWPATLGFSSTTNRTSIYVTYTASGGGTVVKNTRTLLGVGA
jgi:hypothetical protein